METTNGSKRAYTIEVVGELDGTISSARPTNINVLLEVPSKPIGDISWQITRVQIEKCLKSNDTIEAWRILDEYRRITESYKCPMHVFQYDDQKKDGERIPFLGAHCVFGALHDCIAMSYFKEVGIYKKKGDAGRSVTLLRNFIKIYPYHIFFHRPVLDGGANLIQKPDEIEGQHPSGSVKGFSKYEVIHPPAQFKFRVAVNPLPPFEALKDQKLMQEIIDQAVNHGLGGRRSAGYGMWKIVEMGVI